MIIKEQYEIYWIQWIMNIYGKLDCSKNFGAFAKIFIQFIFYGVLPFWLVANSPRLISK